MLINKETCTDCELCVNRCVVGAIKPDTPEGVQIDLDECVECGVCERYKVCPTDSLYQQELEWPRTLRSVLSNPLSLTKETNVPGRGTEEMKTNEVTGRFQPGWVGIGIELGRPGIATRMTEVEKLSTELAKMGIEFEQANPVTYAMSDTSKGKLKEEVLNEKALSAIIEFAVSEDKVEEVLSKIKEIEPQIDTVFSVDICAKVSEDAFVPYKDTVKKLGLWISPNGKHNVGLGRPRVL